MSVILKLCVHNGDDDKYPPKNLIDARNQTSGCHSALESNGFNPGDRLDLN
jgi:hypothetical protein